MYIMLFLPIINDQVVYIITQVVFVRKAIKRYCKLSAGDIDIESLIHMVWRWRIADYKKILSKQFERDRSLRLHMKRVRFRTV